MKINRSNIFIAISSIALLIVLVIQLSWIIQTARVKEKLFNEKANLVLAKTAEALNTDTITCNNIRVCVGRNETRKIDSLFAHYMMLYNIHIDYYFEVRAGTPPKGQINLTLPANNNKPGCYQACVGNNLNENALELKLIFPGQEQYIMNEMKTMFGASLILILVVLVMSWQTVASLVKEKRISEHTTEFLNNMTHEFKTPLTNIGLAAKMITKENNIKQEDRLKHYSGIILEENEKLRLQVEQVLSMTALERGEIPIRKTELNLHQLIDEVIKSFSVQAENLKGSLKSDLSAEKYMVMGDKTYLTNALCNLVDNAMKYSAGKPEINIETYNTENNIVIVISDNGIGIEKKYHKKIFDTFFRIPTGNVHDVKGFGLGLAYVKKIIELHEGNITLESEKGKGTVFIINLPNV